MNLKALRPWATPLTVGTTLVTLVTGVLLFFHLAPGLTRVSHEWIGMIMVAAVAAHLVLNWRAFTTYFKRPIGLSIMALGVAATALTFALAPAREGNTGSPVGQVMRVMGDAEIGAIAALAHKDIASVLAELSGAGVTADPGVTLAEAAGGDRARQMELLQVILGD